MITIDGSIGEGGGQILRTALCLSVTTGQPFRIAQIRAARPKPGLLRQHLTAVRAAAEISHARVTGDALGSLELTFEPGAVEPGEFLYSVGSAGSATLVLQTVLLPLLLAPGPSTVVIEGGTHNPWAPPFDFLQRVFVPIVNRAGGSVDVRLERHGFYPAGGGRFTASIGGSASVRHLDLSDRGDIVTRTVRALVANLPRHIAEREVRTALGLLNWPEDGGVVDVVDGSLGPGNIVFVEIASTNVTEVFTGFGESGVAAEAVAEHVVHDARRYLAAGVPVGPWLADQLLLVLAVGQGGRFRTVKLSRHAQTNADVLRRFLEVRITVTDDGHDRVAVEVERH